MHHACAVTCTGESITGVACWTGAVVTVRYVVAGSQRTAAAVVRCALVNVWNFRREVAISHRKLIREINSFSFRWNITCLSGPYWTALRTYDSTHWNSNLYILNAVSCLAYVTYVRNAGRGHLSSEWCHNENDVIMRTGAASAVGARRANDVIMRMTS